MAANTSFKIQCPSCEAMVPIRDSNLVGKKIDCPKCKYRFIVEDPGDAETGEKAAKPKKKAKAKAKSGPNMAVIGGVLGVVGLGVLGGVGYMLFGGEEPAKPSPSPVVARPNPVTPTDTPATTTDGQPAATPDNPPPAGENPPPTPAPATTAATPPSPPIKLPGDDLTNALPDDTQSVISIHIERLVRGSTLGNQAFETRFGFKNEAFKNAIGIDITEMSRLVRGEILQSNQVFNVLRTTHPISVEQLRGPLGLNKGAKSPINGREYYKIAPNAMLDNLSSILQSELEARDTKAASEKKKDISSLAFTFVDPKTLVFASQSLVEEFLQKNGQWHLHSKLTPGAGGDAATPPPGGETPAGPTTGRRGGRGGATDGDPAAGTGEATDPQFSNRPTYLTVDRTLKTALDRIEGGERKVIFAMAIRPAANEKAVQRIRQMIGLPALLVPLDGMDAISVMLGEFDIGRFAAAADVDFRRERDAKDYEEILKKVMPDAGRFLSLFLGGLKIDVEGGSGGSDSGGPGGGRPNVGVGTPGGAPSGGGFDDDRNASGGPGAGGTDGPKSRIGLTRKNRQLSFDADLNLNNTAYERLYAVTEGMVIRMRGMVDMSGGLPRWPELAAAAKKQVNEDKDKLFPRGTYKRESDVGDRLSRTWGPNQRVSWMVSLLPHLGYEDLYGQIEQKKSWRDEENLKRGQMLIPQFLNPSYPRAYWRANVASLGSRDQGATHVVGVAGIGADAADYKMADASVSNKIGMVGYDRRTGIKDVSDGLANTIYMIQVTPQLPRPWIAGGGSTITGIPEKDCVKGFATTQANGKRGAMVIMADGSVRVVADNISDEVFKKLVTIRGGEEVTDLDKVAPRYVPPKTNEMKTDDK